jgi:hypothetical protein
LKFFRVIGTDSRYALSFTKPYGEKLRGVRCGDYEGQKVDHIVQAIT